MSSGSLKSRLQALLEPLATADGYDVEDVVVTPAGSRRLVRVLIDGDGGITLDDVATFSRMVAEALDDSDVMGSAPYVLEVSSPGVDHPLTLPRHWRRAAGRLVTMTVAGVGPLTARVVRADGDQVTFARSDADEVTYGLDLLGKGAVQVEFSRPGEPALEDDLDDPVEDLDEHDPTDENEEATT